VGEALNKLAGKITAEKMRKLNYQVDGKGKFPKEVAEEFLKKEGFKTKINRNGKADIIIAGKKFTEQFILLEIFKIMIENYTNLTVELKSGLGGTNITFNALQNGQVDIYPEYTGTALFAILKTQAKVYKPIIQDRKKVYEYVNKECQKRFEIVWLEPLGFQNSYALMMQAEKAEKLGIESISDLAKYLNEQYQK